MAISGGIKFFKKSKCLFADGATGEATTGGVSVSQALDRNPLTYYRSVSSSDAITETITVTLTSSVTINRLFLIDHNFKEFNVKYWDGAAFQHFTSVIGIDGAKANISETAFADDTAYYEFASVSTTKIQIQATKTQTANQEKYLNQLVITEELGTLQGYPQIKKTKLDRNERKREMLSGKMLVQKSEEAFQFTLDFKNYPASLSADVDLIFSLFDYEDNFIVWLSGGRRGSTYFKKQLRGWRLKDAFTMQILGALDPDYTQNIYTNPVNFTIQLVEAVD